MLERYITVNKRAQAEIVIKRSRFIGHAVPVESEEEALAFIEAIRKEHSQASHNCYAYMIGQRDEYQKQSDDGEPSGTAGKPILEVLKMRGMKNTAVVVTRYFGGVMLGAGGLVRAYTDGAVAALDAAEPVARLLHRELQIVADYTWHGKIEYELRQQGILIADTAFADKVTLTLLPLAAEAEPLAARLTDLTGGQCPIAVGESVYRNHPLQ